MNPWDWYKNSLEIKDLNNRSIYFKLGLSNEKLRPWALYGIGFVYLAQNDIKRYRDAFRQDDLFDILQYYVEDWIQLGDQLFTQGNYECALEAYLKALDGDPENEIALANFFHLTSLNFSAEDLYLKEAIPNRARRLKLILATRAGIQDLLFRNLATEADYLVRRAVAINQNTPLDLLKLLAKDTNPCVKFGILENSACPSELKNNLKRELRDNILNLYDFNLDQCLISFNRDEEEITEIWSYKMPYSMESQDGLKNRLVGCLSVEFQYYNGLYNHTTPFFHLRSESGNYLSVIILNFESARYCRLFNDLMSEYHNDNRMLAGEKIFDSLMLIPKSEQFARAYSIIQALLNRKKIYEKPSLFGNWQKVLHDKTFIQYITHSGWRYLFFDCVSNLFYSHPEKYDRELFFEILKEIKTIQYCATNPLIMQSTNIDSLQQLYYVSRWGFDPLNDWIPLPSGRLRYESRFLPVSDTNLMEAGVEIFARVDFDPNEKKNVHNRIVFRNSSTLQEGAVECTHTLVYQGPGEMALTFAYDETLPDSLITERLNGKYQNNQLEILTPEEHFVALRSYIGALIEMGITRLLQEASKSDTELPFGFNAVMERQVIGALGIIVPQSIISLVTDVLLELIECTSEEWFTSRLFLLKDRFGPMLEKALLYLINNNLIPCGKEYVKGYLEIISAEDKK